MDQPKDWRLTNQESYLLGVTLVHRDYEPNDPGNAGPDNDHDHCEFCWAKFMRSGGPDTLTKGYATLDGYRWICDSCFRDFEQRFHWVVENAA